MPDPSRPRATSEPQDSAGEFDFAQAKPANPRIKRRSLKAKPTVKADASPEASPPADVQPVAEPQPAPEVAPAARPESARAQATSAAAPAPAQTLPRKLHTVSQVPESKPDPLYNSNPSPSVQAHPSTLYYSSGARKEKEDAPPMKTSNSGASPASHVTASSPIRPATTPGRATSVVDYRANIERQAREQKSVGGLLSYVVYALLAFFVLGAILAAYGGYVVSKQIHQQSVTVSDLDKRYAAQNDQITSELKATNEALIQAQTQITRQQELIAREQDAINKLMATSDRLMATSDRLISANAATESGLRQERQARAAELASLRAKIRAMEIPSHVGP